MNLSAVDFVSETWSVSWLVTWTCDVEKKVSFEVILTLTFYKSRTEADI